MANWNGFVYLKDMKNFVSQDAEAIAAFCRNRSLPLKNREAMLALSSSETYIHLLVSHGTISTSRATLRHHLVMSSSAC